MDAETKRHHFIQEQSGLSNPELKEGNTIYVVSIDNTLVVKPVDFDGADQSLK